MFTCGGESGGGRSCTEGQRILSRGRAVLSVSSGRSWAMVPVRRGCKDKGVWLGEVAKAKSLARVGFVLTSLGFELGVEAACMDIGVMAATRSGFYCSCSATTATRSLEIALRRWQLAFFLLRLIGSARLYHKRLTQPVGDIQLALSGLNNITADFTCSLQPAAAAETAACIWLQRQLASVNVSSSNKTSAAHLRTSTRTFVIGQCGCSSALSISDFASAVAWCALAAASVTARNDSATKATVQTFAAAPVSALVPAASWW
jgi:hypothetical protein